MNDILEKKSNKKVKKLKNVEEKKQKKKNKCIYNISDFIANICFGKDNPEIVANIFYFYCFLYYCFGCFKSKINK